MKHKHDPEEITRSHQAKTGRPSNQTMVLAAGVLTFLVLASIFARVMRSEPANGEVVHNDDTSIDHITCSITGRR